MSSKIWMGVSAMAMAVVLAACGSSASNTTASAAGSSKKGPSGGQSSQMKSGSLGARTISGAGNVLTTTSGMTLYMRTTDKNGKITCTGSCTSQWPPLIAKSSTPALPSGVTGKIATVTRPDNGDKQVTFAGHPLYTFVDDSAPGQANGQGLGGVWFAMKTNPGSGGNGSNGGGYGY